MTKVVYDLSGCCLGQKVRVDYKTFKHAADSQLSMSPTELKKLLADAFSNGRFWLKASV